MNEFEVEQRQISLGVQDLLDAFVPLEGRRLLHVTWAPGVVELAFENNNSLDPNLISIFNNGDIFIGHLSDEGLAAYSRMEDQLS